MLLIYNILFPLVLLAFLPGLIYKLIKRPGWKKTFWERFGIFSKEQKDKLKEYRGAVWIHAVSVGETNVALEMLKDWKKVNPERRFVLSTTTTTGQQLARDKAPEDLPVIYCPLDYSPIINRTFKLFDPEMLVILETEIWPAMLARARKNGGKAALVNARLSDHSVKGYRRFKFIFRPIFSMFNLVCAQSENDAKRYLSVAPDLNVKAAGNMKFDQKIPDNLKHIDLKPYFGDGPFLYLLAASTHPGEEKLLAETFIKLKPDFPELRMIVVPRHAERGSEIAGELKSLGMNFHRRTMKEPPKGPVDILLADTTGEMLNFINQSDIVIMGKSLAGHDEGHNLIEPALLGKPIVTGNVLRNFRVALQILREQNALITVENEQQLSESLRELLASPKRREGLGKLAKEAILKHRGAIHRSIEQLEELLK